MVASWHLSRIEKVSGFNSRCHSLFLMRVFAVFYLVLVACTPVDELSTTPEAVDNTGDSDEIDKSGDQRRAFGVWQDLFG